MNFGDTTFSELPSASTKEMYNTHNGEVFSIVLSIQTHKEVDLDLN